MTWDTVPHELDDLSRVFRRDAQMERTAEFLSAEAGRFHAQWRSLGKLLAANMPIPLPRDQNLHPVGCVLENAYLSFIFARGSAGDPLPKQADFQVQIEGALVTDETYTELQDNWRVDTHLYAPQQPLDPAGAVAKKAPLPPREPHPLFHFQRGGHAQDAFSTAPGFVPSQNSGLTGDHWKGLLQCPGPRMPALPMDPVLMIDFCIGQNDGPVWTRLRNTPEYLTLIENSQKRLWKPFFEGLQAREVRRRWLGPLALA